MATFYNQATLSYNGIVTDSNVTEGEIVGALEVAKTAISTSYRRGNTIAYAVSILNSSESTTGGVTLADSLGSYEVGGVTYRPLDYLDGSVRLFIGGTLVAPPTVSTEGVLTFSGISIPANTSAILIYQATVNDTAPLAVGSQITNTVTVSGSCEDVIASATVPVREETSLTIAKAISPEAVSCGEEISYTFIIQNTGNTAADETAGVSVRDVFTPILNGISVRLNGQPFPATSYTYDTATGAFVTTAGEITVPAATYTQDPLSGAVTLTPGVAVLTVTGTV